MGAAILNVILRRLEALEERIRTGVVGDIGEEFVRKGGDGPRLDFGGGELGADQIGRGGLGERKDFALGVGMA